MNEEDKKEFEKRQRSASPQNLVLNWQHLVR